MKKTYFLCLALIALFLPLCLSELSAEESELAAQEPGTEPKTEAEQGSTPLPPPETSSLEEQRLQIIRYGTDTEIANLIKILRNEQSSNSARRDGTAKESILDKELFTVAENTKNRAILTGVFGYFSDREIEGLEDRALLAVEERDYEAPETVNAAIFYLGKMQSDKVRDELVNILNGEETRLIPAAIRALGQIAEKNKSTETADYLIDYYTNRDPGDENRRLLIAAVGDTKSNAGTDFLVSIVENDDEKAFLRITALDALAKIADPNGLQAIIGAVSARDPNVRAAAIAALEPFPGREADEAIIEAFRDSFFRTRLAAAKAAGERKLDAAVPFLRFRSENDDVPAVREEAIKAMGIIGTKESEDILESLFKERKNNDRVRINAGDMLLTHGKKDYVTDVIIELDEAKSRNQTALYNGFLRILGNAKSPKLEDLARRFFASGGVIEKSYALDICLNNDFYSLKDEVVKLSDPKNASLSRKSNALLEHWGESADSTTSSSSTSPSSTEEAQAPLSSEEADS